MPKQSQEERNQYLKERRLRYPEYFHRYNKKYREEHREELNQYLKDWRKTLTGSIKRILGGKCSCCGEMEFEFLTLDHRNQDGGGGKRENHYNDYKFVKDCFKTGRLAEAEAKYTLLCWNCNTSKRYGSCRHTGRELPTEGVKKRTLYMRNIGYEIRALLGSQCTCCGENEPEFLTLDHINNDGNMEKKGKNGTRNVFSYYLQIRKILRSGDQQAISDVRTRFQNLCWNCNASKHYGKGLCVHKRKGAGLTPAPFSNPLM